MKWSILICTLEERREQYQALEDILRDQISEAGFTINKDIQILSCEDAGQMSVGTKRNLLLDAAEGKYLNFIDDDDEVSYDYVPLIMEAFDQDPDVVGMVGQMTTNGQNPQMFKHSIQYDDWFQKGSVFYRPPNHLNPMRRRIAELFRFPDKYAGEDKDWSMRIKKSNMLKDEVFIEPTIYFYNWSAEGTRTMLRR